VDEYTKNHFEEWLSRQYGDDSDYWNLHKEVCRERVLKLIEDDPELLDNHTWGELRGMVGL